MIWRLDRLGRSLRHLIDTVAELARREVAFRSLVESIDTATPGGKLVFHLFGALAEFERDLIRERTVAGLAAARARGRLGGRPTVMTPADVGWHVGNSRRIGPDGWRASWCTVGAVAVSEVALSQVTVAAATSQGGPWCRPEFV